MGELTDRELLELAAKAAGIKYHAYVDSEIFGRGVNIGEVDVPLWNPLADDGDALRLAGRLNMVLEFMVRQSAARTFDGRFAGCVDHAGTAKYPGRPFRPNPAAAARLAIVITAAEIGKGM